MSSPSFDQLSGAQQPTSQPAKPDARPETSSATPAVGKPDDRKALFFKTQDKTLLASFEKSLKTCWKQHIDDWGVQRRAVLREILRALEYRNGNQHIGWDPLTCSYVGYNDIMRSAGWNAGTEQGKTDYTPQKNVNVIDWGCRVWCSVIGAAIPGIEWWPGDSDSDLDCRAAVTRDRAYKKIASDNVDKDFLEQCLEFLHLTGSYFRYIRWSMDPELTKTHYEDVTEMQERQVSPDRFVCPSCGAEVPVEVQQDFHSSVPCPRCGRPLTQANFYPGARIKMPVVTGQREVPNGQVRWDVYHGLSVQGMPQANTNGGGVIANSPLLELQREITKGAFRRLYPDNWDLAKQSSSDSGSGDGELARLARMRTTSPGGFRWGTNSLQKMNTLHSVWFTQDAIMALDDQKEAQKLADCVGDGCVGVFFQDKLIDIQPDVKGKRWTWCGAKKGSGMYPTAPVRLGLDFQDRINDRVDSCDDYFDRLGNPPILVNQTVFGESLNGAQLSAGTFMGVAVNNDTGRTLKDNFFQPEFHQDNGVMPWIEALLKYFQLLMGLTPQTFGGSDKDIKTAAGQEQALKTAMSILWQFWNLVRTEWSQAANLSVDCFAANATDDEYRVTKSESSSDFENEPIRLADLDGKADARPEANQDYPIGFEQQRELYKEMFAMASGKEPNPLIMEILDTPENRRIAMRYLGPPDMELPEQIFIDKIKADIGRLISEQPVPSRVVDGQSGQVQQVMKPSVEPDKDYFAGKWDLVIGQIVRYGVKNWQELPPGSPADVQLRGYLKLATMYMQMEKLAGVAGPALLDSGAPGWAGSLGKPSPTGKSAAAGAGQ
ncbi:MAG: hypothetical protein WBX10_08730 [Candidatus Sulfotelmatobacter sp.]